MEITISQKAMGIIALQLYLAGINNDIKVPFWVIVISISTLTIGISLGGTKIIKTVGYKIFKIRPLHSFASQLSVSTILLFSNLFGAPVSTTQIISSSVVGVGSAYRSRGVKWSLIKIFNIEPTKELLIMAKVLREGTLEIYDSLRNLKENPNVAMEHAKRAKATENQMNVVYLESLAELFDDENNTTSYMMKMRELYRHLKRSADSCDDAANVISDIIEKS